MADSMDIAIIGAGYVGLVTGGGLASLGHRVRLGEANAERVELLRNGGIPIYEQGLPDLLSHATGRGLLSFHTSNKEAVHGPASSFSPCPLRKGRTAGPTSNTSMRWWTSLPTRSGRTPFLSSSPLCRRAPLRRCVSGWQTSGARHASSPTPSSSVRGRRWTTSSSQTESWWAPGKRPMPRLWLISTEASTRQ